MGKFGLAILILVGMPALAQTPTPFLVGEWAGDCRGSFRIGYRVGPDGRLIAYTVSNGISSDFGKPRILSEDAEFFMLDFEDGGAPILWRKAGQTIRPWSQGENGSIIKNGIREGSPTATFERCR